MSDTFRASNGVVILKSGDFLLSDDFEPLWPSAQKALLEYFISQKEELIV